MATKYVHARMPGRMLIHLIPPGALKLDARFGEESMFVKGHARALCGRKSSGWTVDMGGEWCLMCQAKR